MLLILIMREFVVEFKSKSVDNLIDSCCKQKIVAKQTLYKSQLIKLLIFDFIRGFGRANLKTGAWVNQAAIAAEMAESNACGLTGFVT